MLTVLTFIGSLLLASFGFLLGKMFSESEKILSEKRATYIEFLSSLPPINDTYLENSDEQIIKSLRLSEEKAPKLLFYADPNVALAWSALLEKYWEANDALAPTSPALAPEFQALAKAQNDLVLEMRRDAFRWSIFNYSGKSRTNS